jgi:glycosyltransferase involved in cell wall biosynthesis
MKILHVTNSFKPAWETGGTCRVAYEISKRMADRGHDVTVFTTDRASERLSVPKNTPVVVDGVEVYYFRNLSNALAARNVPLPYCLPVVASELIQDFDIIHIHEHRSVLAAITSMQASIHGIPYVLQAHGSVLPIFQKKKLKRLYDRWLGYRILKGARKVIALTETERKSYLSMGIAADRIVLLPNGVDISEYERLPPKGLFKAKYGIEADLKIVLYLGRMNISKGIALLIEAFEGMSSNLDDARLMIVGPDNGERDSLSSLVQSLHLDGTVAFTGFVSDNDRRNALVDSEVLVIPRFLGFPLTFLEACMCGTPIVTTRGGDELDWIDNQVGLVVDYDSRQLREAIVRILSDRNLRNRFGEQGRRMAMERFDWQNIVAQLETVYKSSMQRENVDGQ